MSSFFSFCGFYVSGSSETLVEVSKHKYIFQTTIKVAFVIHFLFQLLISSHQIICEVFVFMLNKALSMSVSMSYHL